MMYRYYFIISLISLFTTIIPSNIINQKCTEPLFYGSDALPCENANINDWLLINKNIAILGKAILKKCLKISRNAFIRGKLKVGKKAKFKKNVTVHGVLTAENLNITDNIFLQNATITGNLQCTNFTQTGVVHNNSSGLLLSSLIVNADISPSAAIMDSKLAPISSPGKVANSATTATSTNTGSTIVMRDAFGNFATTMITIAGTVTNPTDVATKAYVDSSVPSSGSSDNIPNTLVLRDESGGFSAGSISLVDEVISNSLIITPFITNGVVHNDSSGLLSSSLIVNVDVSATAAIDDTKLATIITSGKIANSATTATSSNVANTIVSRDALGNFITTMITITGSVTNPTDVTTKAYVDAAVIPSTGTPLNIPNAIVERDNTGSFAAQIVSVVDTVLTGNIILGNSINTTMGNIIKNGISFMHNHGTNNTFIGANAGNFTTSGIGRNSGLGTDALSGITNGSNNIAIGYQAGQSLTTGNGNIYINANAATGNENGIIRIGSSQAACFIAGISGIGVSGDAVVVDTNGQLGITLSSKRFKHDIQDMGSSSDAILKLHPVTFVYKDDITHTMQYGLIAEEVDEVFPTIVAKDENGIAYTVRYHLLPILLLNELQKQHKVITEHQKTINEIQEYKAVIEDLQDALESLKKEFNEFIHKIVV